ncbi:MAG: cysteine desulfurase [Melioribacteraceae bacterium]|nr:cysteine desulfurase [Melioribacteraceae bacterium]
MEKIYLDNAASTAIHPKVIEKMVPFMKENYGNPSSIHSFGRKVRVALEEAREIIADFINADSGEIYFTSGGTEANNLALRGISIGDKKDRGKNRIISSPIEHHCVLDYTKELSNIGFLISLIENGNDFLIDQIKFKKELTDDVSLASFMYVNNEVGSINEIQSLASLAKNNNTYFHTDAVQAFGKIKIDVKELGIDSLAASSHKIAGPKGAGFLYVKSGTPLEPLIIGGSQERNRRGGTENTLAIIGFAEAVRLIHDKIDDNYIYVTMLRDYFRDNLLNQISDIKINKPINDFPYILNFTFDNNIYNNDSEAMLMYLDLNGIAASAGSACTSGTLKPSHVLLNSGYDYENAKGTIRVSFSPFNSTNELDYALEVFYKLSKNFKK